MSTVHKVVNHGEVSFQTSSALSSDFASAFLKRGRATLVKLNKVCSLALEKRERFSALPSKRNKVMKVEINI